MSAFFKVSYINYVCVYTAITINVIGSKLKA